MNSEYFHYILTIAEDKSFSKAAKRLNISQPALSAYVSKLEANLGAPIFDRSLNPLKLTAIGASYIQMIKAVQYKERVFRQHVSDLHELKTGNLVIAGSSCFTSSYLPRIIAEFLRQYPGISIKIIDGRTPDLSQRTLSGEIDFFISPSDKDIEGLEYVDLLQERIFICVPEQWKLNRELQAYRVPLEDMMSGQAVSKEYKELDAFAFANYPFILLEEDLHIRKISDKFFGNASQHAENSITVNQMMTSFALTLSGVGVSFMSDSVIRYGKTGNMPAFYAFDKNISLRRLSIVFKKSGYQSVAAKEFIRLMLKNYSQTL